MRGSGCGSLGVCSRAFDPDSASSRWPVPRLVPYFNFLGLRFDHNAVLGALWRRPRCASSAPTRRGRRPGLRLAGAAAAGAMLGKYWSICCSRVLLWRRSPLTRRAIYFRSAAPRITVGIGALLLAPHVVWLVTHDLMPLTYAPDAHSAKRSTDDDNALRVILIAGRAKAWRSAGDFGSWLSTRRAGAASADTAAAALCPSGGSSRSAFLATRW